MIKQNLLIYKSKKWHPKIQMIGLKMASVILRIRVVSLVIQGLVILVHLMSLSLRLIKLRSLIMDLAILIK